MSKKKIYNIGGEFEFNDSNYKSHKLNKFSKVEKNFTINGISSFFQILLLLKSKQIQKIYIPNLLCRSLLNTIKRVNFKYEFYQVDDDYNSSCIPDENSSILIIHYFGKQNNNINKLKKLQKKKIFIIEDASHIFLNKSFSLSSKNFLFLSLRKHGFFGPGGWSNKNFDLKKCGSVEYDYLKRNIELRKKKDLFLDTGDYIKKDILFVNKFDKLNKFFNNRISFLINDQYYNLLIKINLETIAKKRISNWNYLNQMIGSKFKNVYHSVNENNVPLGFIIFSKKRKILKNYLKKKRIFTSWHWEPKKIVSNNKKMTINKMMQNSLTIPIDQRYDFKDIEYIADKLKKF